MRPYRHETLQHMHRSALTLWLAAALLVAVLVAVTVQPLQRTIVVRVHVSRSGVEYREGDCIETSEGAVLCRGPII